MIREMLRSRKGILCELNEKEKKNDPRDVGEQKRDSV